MKNWLSSPLALNYLLSLCKNGPSYQKKYLQIYKDFKTKEGCINSNQLFLSPTCNPGKQYETSDINIEKIDFEKSREASQCIVKWINHYRNFNKVDIGKYIVPTTTSLLCNVCVFKGVWMCNHQNPVMKVHNSFSYTEDIKYEARLIELPVQDVDFKLVIIVPNEVSSISGLFNKLVEEGLDAAVNCVHPLFTFSTVLEAPSIEFNSETDIHLKSSCDQLNGAQIGNVLINETGINISVLTLLSSAYKNIVSDDEKQIETESPFYFAVLYKDVAVLTGRYVTREK